MSQLALAVHLWDSISQQEVTPGPRDRRKSAGVLPAFFFATTLCWTATGTSHSEMLGAFAERQSITPKSGPEL